MLASFGTVAREQCKQAARTSGIDLVWAVASARPRPFLAFLVSLMRGLHRGHKCIDLPSLCTYALFSVLTDQKESKGISADTPPERETCPAGRIRDAALVSPSSVVFS